MNRDAVMPPTADDLLRLARIARAEHRLDDARRHYEAAVVSLRELGEPFRLAHTIRHLGDVLYEAGHIELAEPQYREALALYRCERGARRLDLANAIRSLAVLTEHAGSPEEARRLWAEALDLYAELGVSSGVSESAARLERLQTGGE